VWTLARYFWPTPNDTLDIIDACDGDRHIYEHIDMARVIKSIAPKAAKSR